MELAERIKVVVARGDAPELDRLLAEVHRLELHDRIRQRTNDTLNIEGTNAGSQGTQDSTAQPS